jgi:dihydroorotate dehydrogenase
MYKLFFRLVFQRMDPEAAHHLAFRWIRLAARIPVLRTFVAAALAPRHRELRTEALGLRMHGPFGLAAGFDKNAVAIDGMSMLGFDHVEIGTVTGEPQPGNPRKRLFRLVADRALINRMGFNNDGAQAAAQRLRALRERRGGGARRPVVGVNIGKTKVVDPQDAPADYRASAERLAALADYVVVNVSSPNTPGLRDLQAVEQLEPIVTAVREAIDASGRRVPLLVKIAPDLADEDVDAVADLALATGLDGIVATNTTIARDGLRADAAAVAAAGAGGLSGAPLRERSLQVLRRLRARVGDRLVLVSVGGVETPEDAFERLRAGATLVQAYTAFVYGGPLWPRRMSRGLARLVREAGASSVAEVTRGA